MSLGHPNAGRRDPRVFYICHADHPHDRVFAENVAEYLDSIGIKSKSIAFGVSGNVRSCAKASSTMSWACLASTRSSTIPGSKRRIS
jgi:hypothetical protein